MDSQDSQKLTKKQKKALAFRERKGKKAAATNLDEENDLPQPDLVLDDEIPTSNEKFSVPPPKKRKREGDEGPAQDIKKKKKTDEPSAVVTVDDKAKAKAKKKQRYILFVGNLAYRTTQESIQTHFAECPDPPSIRLLTPKAAKPGAAAGKSKGCAFLEFPSARSLQAALKLHHSDLDGRKINVELTSGGGGGGENRRETLKARNKALEEEREKKRQAQPDDESTPFVNLPQRHSKTSGSEHNPAISKTWSVPVDGEEPGRGGESNKKKTRRPTKPSKGWGSGANAVAVG